VRGMCLPLFVLKRTCSRLGVHVRELEVVERACTCTYVRSMCLPLFVLKRTYSRVYIQMNEYVWRL